MEKESWKRARINNGFKVFCCKGKKRNEAVKERDKEIRKDRRIKSMDICWW